MKLETSDTYLHLCVGASGSWYTFQKIERKLILAYLFVAILSKVKILLNGNPVFYYAYYDCVPVNANIIFFDRLLFWSQISLESVEKQLKL